MAQDAPPVFVITLRFTDRRDDAPRHLEGHRRWIDEGFATGTFLAVGSLTDGAGGCIVAHNATRRALRHFVESDPFVAHGVVTADILAFTPARVDQRLHFLTTPPA